MKPPLSTSPSHAQPYRAYQSPVTTHPHHPPPTQVRFPHVPRATAAPFELLLHASFCKSRSARSEPELGLGL